MLFNGNEKDIGKRPDKISTDSRFLLRIRVSKRWKTQDFSASNDFFQGRALSIEEIQLEILPAFECENREKLILMALILGFQTCRHGAMYSTNCENLKLSNP